MDDDISYSPLSNFSGEDSEEEPSKSLFPCSTFENEKEDSMLLFSDAFSSEEELCDKTAVCPDTKNKLVTKCSSGFSSTQLEPITSLVLSDQFSPSTAEQKTLSSVSEKEVYGKATKSINPSDPCRQSEQSIILERLRTTLGSSNNSYSRSLDENSTSTEKIPSHYQLPSSQTSVPQTSSAMAPQKSQSKTVQASGLKQMDIGVFFGLKPLKEKEKDADGGLLEQATQPHCTPQESLGKAVERRGGFQRKGRGDVTVEISTGGTTQGDTGAASAQGDEGRSRRGGGRRWWNSRRVDGEPQEPKRCPFYKKIPGTRFAVDAFSYGEVEGIVAYFLTHFHSDHYGGLKKSSTLPIYCNKITGNLVKAKLKVAEEYVHILPMNTLVTVEGVGVTLLEANHCPGSAMLLLYLPDGQTVLHTGDFRANRSMEQYPELQDRRVTTLYLDTTYCSPEYTFPSQEEVISFAVNTVFELVTLHPRTLVVCGSYSVGKEKVFLAMAEVLGSRVCLLRDKYNTMCCLESERIKRLITTDLKAAQVHVLPMARLTFKNLEAYLSKFSAQYDQLVAFKPTGWTFNQQLEAMEDIRPQTSGNITIYGIPYSEHSSFLELKRFVQWLQPLKIVPTVNVGSWASRKAMERCFSDWLQEAKATPNPRSLSSIT